MSRTIILCVNHVTESLGIGINLAQQVIHGDIRRERFTRASIRRSADKRQAHALHGGLWDDMR